MRDENFATEETRFMRRALRLAERGRGMAHPNPLVGAVLVKGGKVLGEGWHRGPGKEHAEVLALREAGRSARGATLYVTLEPCNHEGNTPPCTQAILRAGIKRVVFATRDPNPRVKGKGAEFLRGRGVRVEWGLLEEQARLLNQDWEKFIVTGLPFVTLKVGMTADGKIATRTGKSRWITGEKARRRVHAMRRAADAVMTGIGTVVSDDPELTVREVPLRGAQNPLRVLLDSRLRIPLASRLAEGRPPTVVITTRRHDPARAERLRERGVRVVAVGSSKGRVDVGEALKLLGEEGVVDLLVEAGATLNAALVESGLADRLVLFVAPRVFGGSGSPAWMGGEGVEDLADSFDFAWHKAERVGDDLMLVAHKRKG
jgi:diaminohydroxyphosphoribosylaminopyrimidine deaminase/5-amino-6-(5-phosphoribosylamino)uracil reductase